MDLEVKKKEWFYGLCVLCVVITLNLFLICILIVLLLLWEWLKKIF